MDWKEQYKHKIISANEAARKVKSQDSIYIYGLPTPCVTLRRALETRANELENVKVFDALPGILWAWHNPVFENSFTATSCFLTPQDRVVMDEKQMDYMEMISAVAFKQMERKEKYPIDVMMLTLTPPDKDGYCNFGTAIFWCKSFSARAKTIIAEINPYIPRLCGERGIHVDQVDFMVESTMPPVLGRQALMLYLFKQAYPDKEIDQVAIMPFPVKEEEAGWVDVISAYIAADLIRDGDTIQIGVGPITPGVNAHLYNKNDLGLATEIIPSGTVDLIKAGVYTGKYKTLHPGVVTGTAYAEDTPENLAWLDQNPKVALYDWSYITDPRTIAAHDNLLCINNLVCIDLLGQGMGHAVGARRYTGAGGQLELALSSLYSRGGRNVFALYSTADTPQGRVSRIVPQFEKGSIITSPRSVVDYVVTEYGIASLLGKTDRERAEELISIAHPDFRAELKKEAGWMLWP